MDRSNNLGWKTATKRHEKDQSKNLLFLDLSCRLQAVSKNQLNDLGSPDRNRLGGRGASRLEELPHPPEQLHKSTTRIVIHHDHEQQPDREQPEPQDVLARPHAERAALRRLEDVDQDL